MAGYATPAWSNDQSPAIDDSALLDIGHGIEIAEHPYGVCSTAEGTAAKTVTIDFSGTLTLFTGLTVRVKFQYANKAASPTLNVNGTGAKAIKVYGSADVRQYSWRAGQTATFIYTGTNWEIEETAASIGAAGAGIGLDNNDDLDTIINTGWYTWGGTAAPANAPLTTSYAGVAVECMGSNIKQTYYRAELGTPAHQAMYVRGKYGNHAWTPWHEIDMTSLAADLVLHVNATSGDDSNDGLTAATALKTINAAFAKIPADMSGRRAVVQLANGTYASATLGTRYGGTYQISNETGATQANIKIQGLSISSSCAMTSVFVSNVTFYGGNVTTDYQVLGGFLRVASCIFDNARLVNQGGQCYVNNCTFRNISSSAIYGWQSDLFITSATIESTVTGTGVVTQGGVVTVETITNNATAQYSVSQGGRIFVGGNTYKEASHESIYSSGSNPYSITGGNKDITLTHPMDQYNTIILYLTTSSTNASGTRCMVYFNAWELGAAAEHVITVNGTNFYGVRIGFANSGNYSKLRFISTTAPNLYIVSAEGVYN